MQYCYIKYSESPGPLLNVCLYVGEGHAAEDGCTGTDEHLPASGD